MQEDLVFDNGGENQKGQGEYVVGLLENPTFKGFDSLHKVTLDIEYPLICPKAELESGGMLDAVRNAFE